MKRQGLGRQLRKNAEVFTIVGGLLAVAFPIFGYVLAYIQSAYQAEYQAAYFKLKVAAKLAGRKTPMHPWAAYVLASNQVYMYLYLLPYVLLLQRPKIKRTFKRLSLALPVYLVIGLVNSVINLILMRVDRVKGTTFTTVGYGSSIAVIVFCSVALAGGIALNLLFKQNDSKIAAVDENEEVKAFKKGKTEEEKERQKEMHDEKKALLDNQKVAESQLATSEADAKVVDRT